MAVDGNLHVISRIVVDEAHVLLYDASYRGLATSGAEMMLKGSNIPKTLLSGTVFKFHYPKLFEKLGLHTTASNDSLENIFATEASGSNKVKIFNEETFVRSNIKLSLFVVDSTEEQKLMMSSLINKTIQRKEKSLIFFESKKAMESYQQSLSQLEKGHCCVFHGELPAQEKKTIQDRLRTASDGITLLTTTTASSGLDIDGITSVYLTGFLSLPTLAQIIGRAARKPTETADVKFLFLTHECKNVLQVIMNQHYQRRFQCDENSRIDHIFYKNLFNTTHDSEIGPLIDTFMVRFSSEEELIKTMGRLSPLEVQDNLEARVIQNAHDYTDNIPSKRSAPESSESDEPRNFEE
ncbi:C-terminal helicase domain-containing protein CYBJADRAFT_164775 [Cyberlindnera jadinii NRRL Y-1542]|uniref:ATP-dependent RNA helicase n=1 Tax=Cyberlindnera jadinii (strain ATCC 18201 / CBS 1600 / BCRC 20928 / JCM 3617 / NBRC 0987 / NRRL Y-1542) TaxID=983966 RepID=A0A1E4RUT6_CYBJN|nr:hypothetical protein CYBJADRAFT_164775 [Cyberlindnera jadinii NRRL Y-1542]ODV71032.1 hypothetical protein CYBJADRAFT_164775 [Cyberlindnera jadinii NRRL Y-1542]